MPEQHDDQQDDDAAADPPDQAILASLREFTNRYYAGAGRLGAVDFDQWFTIPTLMDSSSLPGAIRSEGTTLLSSADEIVDWRRSMEDGYRDIDFDRLEAEVVSITLLGDKAALFVGDVTRYRRDNSVINRSNHLYLVLRKAGLWQIFATLPAGSMGA